MDDGYIAILLLVVCVILLIAEVFIPSGGMLLITAGVCLAAAIWFAWRAWFDPSRSSYDPLKWWSFIGTAAVVIPAVAAGLLFWFPRTSMGKRVLLEAPSLEEVTAYDEEAARLRKLIGSRGETVTLLNPGGIVLVDGERHHCETEGMAVEPKQAVEVVNVAANRLVVRSCGEDSVGDAESPTALESKSEPPSDEEPFDFDFPQG